MAGDVVGWVELPMYYVPLPAGFFIRPTSPADAAGVAHCVGHVARERKYLSVTRGFEADETRDFIFAVNANGGVHLSLFHQNAVIGWCDVARCPLEGMTHAGRLGMGVIEAFRGKGLGEALLRCAVNDAFSLGMERVELEVFASNERALKLYRKAGFVQEGVKAKARKLDGVYEDMVVMGLVKKQG